MPPLPIVISRCATPESSRNAPRSPGSVKSSMVVSRVMLATRAKDRQRGGEQSPADAPPERVDLVGPADPVREIDRLHHTLLDVVVPGQMAQLRIRVAPRDEED